MIKDKKNGSNAYALKGRVLPIPKTKNWKVMKGGMVKKIPGTKFITALPDSEKCVSMITFKNKIYVATERGVYILIKNKLVPIKFKIKTKEVTDATFSK